MSVSGQSEKGKSVLQLLIRKRTRIGHAADVPGNRKDQEDQKQEKHKHRQSKAFAGIACNDSLSRHKHR